MNNIKSWQLTEDNIGEIYFLVGDGFCAPQSKPFMLSAVERETHSWIFVAFGEYNRYAPQDCDDADPLDWSLEPYDPTLHLELDSMLNTVSRNLEDLKKELAFVKELWFRDVDPVETDYSVEFQLWKENPDYNPDHDHYDEPKTEVQFDLVSVDSYGEASTITEPSIERFLERWGPVECGGSYLVTYDGIQTFYPKNEAARVWFNKKRFEDCM